MAKDSNTGDARGTTRSAVAPMLSALGHELELRAWELLASRLHEAGLAPAADAAAVRRWLESGLGLTLSVSVNAVFSDVHDAGGMPVSEETIPAAIPSAAGRTRELGLVDEQRQGAPRTDNPLAMAIVNFKGLRGSPEHRLQSPPLRSLDRQLREALKRKSQSADGQGGSREAAPKSHPKRPRWPWG